MNFLLKEKVLNKKKSLKKLTKKLFHTKI
jgi:hypothetical protein